MAKRVRIRLGNPKDKYAPSIIVPGRSKKHALARAKNFIRNRLKNVEEGFYDARGIFHPIRASLDYDPSRAGETKVKSKRLRGHLARARKRRRGAIS